MYRQIVGIRMGTNNSCKTYDKRVDFDFGDVTRFPSYDVYMP